MPKKFRGLAVTLAVAFSAVSLAVILITNGLETYYNFQTQQIVIASQQRVVAEEAANTVKDFIQDKIDALQATIRFGNIMNIRQEEQKVVLNKLLGSESSFRQLVLFDAQNQISIRISRLSSVVSGQLTERAGENVFSQTSKGESYISSIYIDEATSEPMMVMAVPVRDVFGDFKGTLMAEVNLKFMWDLVGGIKIGNKGLAYVVDRQGNLIAFGDISRVLKGENLLYLDEVNKFVSGKDLSGAKSAIMSKGIQGNYIVATHVPLGTPDWAVVVELPVSEAYNTVIQQLKATAWFILLGVALAVVVGFYLSRRITKPIISLRDAAREISRGKLDTKIEIKSKDEIGELATDFSEMAARLGAYTGELEGKVTERTAELAKKLKELAESNTEIDNAKKAMMNLLEDARTLEEELRKEKAGVEKKIQERTQELEYEKTKLNEITQHMTTGAILLDTNSRVSFANAAAFRILNVSETSGILEALAQQFSSIPVKEYIRKSLKGESTDVAEAESREKFFSISFASLKSEAGIFGALIWLSDITTKKLLERSKDQFLAIASHEMRTPLAIIRGNAELLR